MTHPMMRTQKQLVKKGDNYSLILDKSLIAALRFDPCMPLELTKEGHGFLAVRQPHLQRQQKIRQAFDHIQRAYGGLESLPKKPMGR